MSTSFRALSRAGWQMAFGLGLIASAVPAWAQKTADRYTGFEVDLVYAAPDVEHPPRVEKVEPKDGYRLETVSYEVEPGARVTSFRCPRPAREARAWRSPKR